MNVNKNYIALILAHIAIAIIIFFFKPVGRVYFIVALLYFLFKIILVHKSEKTAQILYACAYFVGVEVLFRMTKSALAYEASKYLVIVFMSMGIFFKGVSGKGYPYFLYLILLVPAILVASMTLTFDANFRTNIAFVLSGPVCLGISALYCYDRKVSFKVLNNAIAYLTFPLLSTTTYLFLYNPSIKDTLSGTASNLATSGGFGPNQVATVLGLGMFCLTARFFLNSSTLSLKLLNVTLFGLLSFRAIVTFSRGGVVAAALVILAFLWLLFFKSSSKQKNQIIASGALLIFTIVATWIVSSSQTEGLIDKRYINVDAQGREKKDVTTGRLDLFMEELEGFLDSPFLGVGASRTKDLRVERGVGHLPSHNEVGRLMAEHGFLGIVCLLILIIKPLAYRTQNKRNVFFYAFLAFWFATINHSGLRIAAPSYIYALTLLNVTFNEKNPLRRKQFKP